MSPFVSDAQRKYMNTHKKEIGAKVVEEFNAASKGMKNLPEHVKKHTHKKTSRGK